MRVRAGQGYIYVEAFKEAHVKEAVRGLRICFQSKGAQLVPLREMVDAVTVNAKARAAIGARLRARRVGLGYLLPVQGRAAGAAARDGGRGHRERQGARGHRRAPARPPRRVRVYPSRARGRPPAQR
jgi:hypothetical protein